MLLKDQLDQMSADDLDTMRKHSTNLYVFMSDLKQQGTPSMVQRVLQLAPWSTLHLIPWVYSMIYEHQHVELMVDLLKAHERSGKNLLEVDGVVQDVLNEILRIEYRQHALDDYKKFPIRTLVKELVRQRPELLNDTTWLNQAMDRAWPKIFEWFLEDVLCGITQGLDDEKSDKVVQGVLERIRYKIHHQHLDQLFGLFPSAVEIFIQERLDNDERKQTILPQMPCYRAYLDKQALLAVVDPTQGTTRVMRKL